MTVGEHPRPRGAGRSGAGRAVVAALVVEVSLTLSGVECSGFGYSEESVLKTALAAVLGYDAESIGSMTCKDARRRASYRRSE